jgi:cupin superfamily acireductone dioxygenase involved in methionine salvage
MDTGINGIEHWITMNDWINWMTMNDLNNNEDWITNNANDEWTDEQCNNEQWTMNRWMAMNDGQLNNESHE